MRLILKLTLMTALLCGGLNYAAYLYTGKSLFPLWLEKTRAMAANLGQNASEALAALKAGATEDESSQVIYKWTNEEGVPQFSSAPPPEGIQAEIVKPDPDVNLIRAVPVKESAPAPAAPDSGDVEKTVAGPGEAFPYSPEQVQKTLEDARNARQMMNEKLQQQQRIMENL